MKTQARKMKNPTGKLVLRLLLNHLVFSLITLMLILLIAPMTGKGAAKDMVGPSPETVLPPVAIILPSLLSWVLFAMMTYTEGWRSGERDINLVKYKHITYQPLKGLLGGLLAQIPGVLLAAAALWQQSQPLAGQGGFAGQWAILAVRLFYAPYLWLYTSVGTNIFPAILFAPAILQPLFAQWGYCNGYRFISLYHKIVYKDAKKGATSREKDKRMR